MSTRTAVSVIPGCDICADGTPAYADAFVPPYRTWGNVCKRHFKAAGCRLGAGVGQELILSQDETAVA